MDRKSTHKSIISTGTTSIVLIFVMLSLLTFSVLSLVSARADLRLSRKSADRTTDYHAAENAASDVLSGLLDAAADGPEALAAYADGAGVSLTEGGAAYEVPLGEDQVLAVELTLPSEGQSCRITRWQVVSDYEWNADSHMDLFSTGGLPDAFDTEEQP